MIPTAIAGRSCTICGHEAMNRLISPAEDPKSARSVVGLNPGLMRTERVVAGMKNDEIKLR